MAASSADLGADFYVMVDDIDAALARAEDAGGSIRARPDQGELGREGPSLSADDPCKRIVALSKSKSTTRADGGAP